MKAFLALWGWPIACATASLAGLAGALVGDGFWDWLGWAGLGLPTAAALHLAWRGRQPD